MSKIMFYTKTMSSGGSERVISILANEFVKKHEVTIATLAPADLYYNLDNKIKLIQSSNDNDKFCLVKSALKLYKITIGIKPKVIIAFCPTMCFILGLMKIFSLKFRKIKIIMSERNDPNNKYHNIILKKLANFFYRKADIVVFQNVGAKSFFDKPVQKKSIVIPNPINEKFLNYHVNIKKENSIVNVGRLVPQKNQRLLIYSCAEVFKKYPNWCLKIYGDGSLRDELELLIKQLHMENNIFLLGRCNALEEKLPQNKIFILSSNYEGMPNALMEAMACGLASISTDCPCGGPSDIITDGENGLLVPVNDISAMKKAICSLINNRELLQKITDNSKKIVDSFSTDKIVEKWKQIL